MSAFTDSTVLALASFRGCYHCSSLLYRDKATYRGDARVGEGDGEHTSRILPRVLSLLGVLFSGVAVVAIPTVLGALRDHIAVVLLSFGLGGFVGVASLEWLGGIRKRWPLVAGYLSSGALVVVGIVAVVSTTMPAPAQSRSIGVAGQPNGVTSPGSPSSVAPATAGNGTLPGNVVSHFTVDVAIDYGISFSNSPSQPVESGPNDEDLVVWVEANNLTSKGRIAQLDSSDPSYQACAADTRYGTIDATVGTVGCFTGHGVVAGFKVTALVPSHYTTFDVTVWTNSKS